jgi:nucleoside-diphosphate-sugar epimerase
MNLVTGANGFVGSHLVDRLLARGEPVAAAVRRTADLRWLDGKNLALRFVGLESGEGLEAALRDVRVLYHVAGVTRSATPEAFRKGNCDLSVSLARAALRHAPRLERFLYVSSLAAAGPAREGRPLTEEDPRRPVGAYGESKRDAEEALRSIPSLALTIVRPPIVYGPRDTNFVPLFRGASRRLLPVVGQGRQRLSMVYVEDLAEGMIAAANSKAALGRIYFLTGSDADWREAGEAFRFALGARPWRIHVPPPLVQLAGELFEWKYRLTGVPQAINRRKVREMLEPRWTCSGARAEADFGFRPATALAEGFRKTWKWYRENGWI